MSRPDLRRGPLWLRSPSPEPDPGTRRSRFGRRTRKFSADPRYSQRRCCGPRSSAIKTEPLVENDLLACQHGRAIVVDRVVIVEQVKQPVKHEESELLAQGVALFVSIAGSDRYANRDVPAGKIRVLVRER